MELQISMNIKDIAMPLIIHCTVTESIRTTPSPLNHNTPFLPCQRRGVGAMQYVYSTCVHRFNYSRTLPQRSFPIRAIGHNRNTMTIHRT